MRHCGSNISNARLKRLPRALAAVCLAWLAGGSRLVLAQAPINKFCPMMTLEEVDPAITAQFRGQTVAFCCDTCLKKFQANPERYAGSLTALGAGSDHQAEHDHASQAEDSSTEHDQESNQGMMPFLARIHPVVVHLPLAGVPIAAVALLAWIASRKRAFAAADVPPILLAAASSILAVITGNLSHDSMRFSDALHEYVEWHEYAGTTLMVLLLCLTTIRLWCWRRLDGAWLGVYLGGLPVGVGLVGVFGFLGGSLVFGPDHLWP